MSELTEEALISKLVDKCKQSHDLRRIIKALAEGYRLERNDNYQSFLDCEDVMSGFKIAKPWRKAEDVEN